jgi:hypothetical protein
MLSQAIALFHFLREKKDVIQAVQSVVTTLAIIIGGFWAYLAFGRKREKFPRAKLAHKFGVMPVDANRRILRVELEVENIGDTLLDITSVLNRVQQVFPLAPTKDGEFDPRPSQDVPEIPWPMIADRKLEFITGHREIEPKEPDWFHFDYVLGPEVETVVIYSFVKNARKKRRLFSAKAPKEVGWMKTETVHLDSALIFPMSKPQSSGQTETRQGPPKTAPARTTSGGAAQAQGIAKPQPVKVTPKSK